MGERASGRAGERAYECVGEGAGELPLPMSAYGSAATLNTSQTVTPEVVKKEKKWIDHHIGSQPATTPDMYNEHGHSVTEWVVGVYG